MLSSPPADRLRQLDERRARQQAFLETHDSGLERAAGIADGGQVPPSTVGWLYDSKVNSFYSVGNNLAWRCGGAEVDGSPGILLESGVDNGSAFSQPTSGIYFWRVTSRWTSVLH